MVESAALKMVAWMGWFFEYFKIMFLWIPLYSVGFFWHSILSFALGKWYTSWSMAALLPQQMVQCNAMLKKPRNELLKNLSGTVLDFGAGSGIYMKYCFRDDSKVKKYIALEPNKHLHPILRKTHSRAQDNRRRQFIIPWF